MKLRLLLLVLPGAILSSGALAQADDECLACHSDQSLSLTRRGVEVSLFVDAAKFRSSSHADLGCVGCHEGFNAAEIPHAKKIRPVDCTGCHADSPFVAFPKSVHGRPRSAGGAGLTCGRCHSAHEVRRVSDLPVAEEQKYVVQTCARCHGAIQERFMRSDHGLAVARGAQGAPTCIDCHGEHDIMSHADTSSRTSRIREAEMCMKCHVDNPDVRAKMGPSAGFIAGYGTSVHSQAMHKGNGLAATCSDCHGSHEMRKGSNPGSKVSRANIFSTCGACHRDIERAYASSIHGTAMAKGVESSATCTDCHGEHNILSPTNPKSPVAPANLSAQVCTPCHGSVKLTQKYGLATDRFQTFSDSYHGLAGKGGSVEVANCASCHGVHDIKPSTDSTSRIHKGNLAATCGSCHPGANENFTKGSVHVIASSGEDEILYFVANAYIVLIALTVGGMFFHNLIDFTRKSRRQLAMRRGAMLRPHHGHRLYLRMTLNERIQHGTLVVSFLTLVVTGFALRFPDAWWVVPVRSISPSVFELRSLVHRIAGVVMILASLYHIYYLMAVPRGKELLRDLWPVRKDLTDAMGVLRFNLGLSKEKPFLDRFSYVEKAEYWALVWGTVVMSATGFILWFDNYFMGLLTLTGWQVARTVHYYEAWLATLAIVVWHLYFVMFNPDVYPINLAFWKGTLTEEEMAEEHPLELERLRREAARASEGEPSVVQTEVLESDT